MHFQTLLFQYTLQVKLYSLDFLDMTKLKYYIFIIIYLLFFKNINAQILNLDRVVNDSMTKPWYVLVSGYISFDKQSRNIADVSGYTEMVIKRKNNFGYVYIGQYDGTLSQGSFIQNEGYFQFRYRDLDTRVKSMEAFAQYQWNGIWGMESRFLIGANFRQRLFVNKNADGFLSLGLFHQNERWNYSGVELNQNVFNLQDKVLDNGIRSNFNVKVAKKLFKNCDFVIQNVIQTNIYKLSVNPRIRWFVIAELTYDINNRFQITYAYDHMYNQQPIVPINKLYFGTSLNLSIKL